MPNGNIPAGYTVQTDPGKAMQRLSREPLYDTVVLAAGVPILQATFFAIPAGQVLAGGVGPKTLQDTNMNSAGQIATPSTMFVQGIAMNVQYGATQADSNLIYNAASLQFLLGQTPMVRIPLCAIPTVGGFIGATTLNNTAFLCNGVPEIGSMYKVGSKGQKSIQLNSGEAFSVVIDWRGAITPVAAVRLQVFLFGMQGVPVR